MPKSAKISFIVCTFNRAAYLDDTLLSLTEGESPHQQVEILVIDNNSEDETAGVVQRHMDRETVNFTIRYIEEKKQGLSHARNRGIREAAAPIIIFVDDDIRADEKYINSWLHFFNDKPNVMAAGGKIHVQFDDPRPRWMSHFLLPLLGHHDFGNSVKRYRKINYPFGGNMAFQKKIFNQVEPFDTGLGRTGKDLKASEEKELFDRLKKYKFEIFYVPNAKLYHRVNASRLTQDYIRRQAIGLGESMALQLQYRSASGKMRILSAELFKWVVSVGLLVPYTLTFQVQKAIMMLKFRKWIAEGYRSFNK